MVSAIILAAGRSQRMGTQKLLLPFGDGTVIGHVVDAVRRSLVDQVIVVAGQDAAAITAVLAGQPVEIVTNPAPDGDMLSSVRCGLRAVSARCTAVLVVLGDQPSLSTALVTRLIEAYRACGDGILVPAHGGRAGHPLLLSVRYRQEVLTSYDEKGLCGLLEAHPGEVREIEVPDPAVLADMDTPADYRRELARLGKPTQGFGASAHRVVHRRAPREWHDGFPLGNGAIGAMLWGDGNPLCLTLDKADLWDLRSADAYQAHPDFNFAGLRRLIAEKRFDEAFEIFEAKQLRDNPVGPTKISIGRAELVLGEASAYECRLELATATVEGRLRTAAGEHRLLAFVQRGRNLVCLRLTAPPATASLNLVPLAQMNNALTPLGHPPPQVADEGPLRILCQSIPDGPGYAIVWNPRGPDHFLAIESAATPAAARELALATWHAAAAAGLDCLHDEHVQGWREFWEGSAVHLPEARMEFLWYLGLYLLASAVRRGELPPGLQGLWAMDGVLPPWRGEYAADMNLQETFWPALAGGHLDLLDSWCDLMRDCLPLVQDFTRRFFGTEGTFWPCSFAPRLALIRCWYTVMYGWSHSGWLAWLVWQRWRYSLDLDWLASTGYPLVSEIFRFYRANLQPEADGYLHVPLSTSPEYRDNTPGAWCKDPNIDLAIIRRCCDWVVEMEAALGRSDLTAAALQVRQTLVPYALTAGKALCLWPGQPLDEPHRHPSHLMAIHPAMDLTIEGNDEARQVIDASMAQYFSLGQHQWAGHTYAQMASFAAVIGRAEFAYDCLLHFAEYWIGPNGLHFNRDVRCTGTTLYCGSARAFTMEANCGSAAGINDMLLQGWGDTVRVFPAIPSHWRDVAFHDLLTEGAFRVTAIRRDGRTVWVSVRASVGRTLRLRDPFGADPVSVCGGELCREGGLFIGALAAGQQVTLCLPGETGDLGAAVAEVQRSDTSRLGLR